MKMGIKSTGNLRAGYSQFPAKEAARFHLGVWGVTLLRQTIWFRKRLGLRSESHKLSHTGGNAERMGLRLGGESSSGEGQTEKERRVFFPRLLGEVRLNSEGGKKGKNPQQYEYAVADR